MIFAQKLVIEKTTIDCGRTGYEQPITATFELRNKSRRSLVIESVKPDCGCTAVDYPKKVGAGDKFTIKMTYDARQLGHFHKMAAVTSNGTKTPVYLTMQGVVLAEMVDYSGNYPLSMGELLLDKAEMKTVPIMIAQLRSADYSKFDMGKVYMFILLAILPVIVVYVILSRSIIRGATAGAVKG